MTRTRAPRRTALLTLALAVLLAAGASAGEFTSKVGSGGESFFASPDCPAKQFPTFESLVPIPNIIDPFQQDLIPMFCQVFADKEGDAVKKVKGKFETELIVIDNNTGVAESFPIGSGKFKTDKNGQDSFDFDIPTELFADGFESGDVSAWSYTRSDFTNRKRVNQAQVSCGTSGSKSN